MGNYTPNITIKPSCPTKQTPIYKNVDVSKGSGICIKVGDKISLLVNDLNFITAAQAPIQTVTGNLVDNTDPANPKINLSGTGNFLSIGDNISQLANDANYITINDVPILTVTGDGVSEPTPGNIVITMPDLSNYLQQGDAISLLTNDSLYITGVDWDEIGGLQSLINISGFNNDAGFITASQVSMAAPIQSVTGSAVTGTASDPVINHPSWSDIQGSQSVINISGFTNDSNYVDAAGAAAAAPIQTVTGTAVNNTDTANPVIDRSNLLWIESSANISLNNFEGVLADTTGGAFSATLPANPDIGDTVGFTDAASNFDVNSLNILRNGSLIMGQADDLEIDLKDASFILIYTGATTGWKLDTFLDADDKNYSIDDLLDVTTTGSNSGDMLVKSGSTWVPLVGSENDIIKAGATGFEAIAHKEALKSKVPFEKSPINANDIHNIFAWDNVDRPDTGAFGGAGSLESGQQWQTLVGQTARVDNNTVILATNIAQNAVTAFERQGFSGTGSVLCKFSIISQNNGQGRFYIGKDEDNGIAIRIGYFNNQIIARDSGVETILASESMNVNISQAINRSYVDVSVLFIRGGVNDNAFVSLSIQEIGLYLEAFGSSASAAINSIFLSANDVKYFGVQTLIALAAGVGIRNLRCYNLR